MDKPKRWFKNVIKTFNPVAGFWPKVGLKQPSNF